MVHHVFFMFCCRFSYGVDRFSLNCFACSVCFVSVFISRLCVFFEVSPFVCMVFRVPFIGFLILFAVENM